MDARLGRLELMYAPTIRVLRAQRTRICIGRVLPERIDIGVRIARVVRERRGIHLLSAPRSITSPPAPLESDLPLARLELVRLLLCRGLFESALKLLELGGVTKPSHSYNASRSRSLLKNGGSLPIDGFLPVVQHLRERLTSRRLCRRGCVGLYTVGKRSTRRVKGIV
jgi:hypothetical protein